MRKRYSFLIRPLFVTTDLLVINLVLLYVSDKEYLNFPFLAYINLFWLISSLFTGYYKVFRNTIVYRLFSLLFLQFSLFLLGYFTFFGLYREGDVIHNQAFILFSIILSLSFVKFLSFYALKNYRYRGQNFRNVIILGVDESAKKMARIFNKKKSLGYVFKGFFTNTNSKNPNILGKLDIYQDYVVKENIDELFCSASELNQTEIKDIIKFANENNCKVKLIPNPTELYNKAQSLEYYNGSTLVLNVEPLPFEKRENKIYKRIFDILFSSFIILFIMSWLVPILWVLIKLESNGPAIFKQKREGLKGSQFTCYKFRSMKGINKKDVLHVKKNDVRVTKIGKFLRKSSLDELPQFFNVLLGDMSVVGPRPHMKSLAQEYQKDVDNYIERHAVKPGITGLAQISGYRGEIKKKSDIKNRVRLDIFYIENWSFFLDLKIIIQTVFNVFEGEENAY